MAQASNTNLIQFPAATIAGLDVTHIGLRTAQAAGTFLGGKAVSGNPAAIQIGQRYQLAAGEIDLVVANGDYVAAMAERFVRGGIAAGLWISLHTGNPGNNGANEISESWYSRVQVPQASWTVTQ